MGDFSGILKKITKYKYLILVALVGIIMLLIPTGGAGEATGNRVSPGIEAPEFSLPAEEGRLEKALESVEGAGDVRVVLSLRGGVEREVVPGRDGALVVSAGSGAQAAVERRFIYPEYLGALIICDGADMPKVKLDIIHAVQSVTGLGSDKITVIKMKKS